MQLLVSANLRAAQYAASDHEETHMPQHTIFLAKITQLNHLSKSETVEVEIDALDPEAVEWDNNTIHFTLHALQFAVPDGPKPESVEYANGQLRWGSYSCFPFARHDPAEVYFTEPLMWTLKKAMCEGTASYAQARAWMREHGLTEALQAGDRTFYDPANPRFIILQPVTTFA
ncbi:hypothetical protein EPO04_00405 [Patescibacteria group bacterium]|nr:MAG: hypothetical protein EPO04_00405 [Patescibacteria group bacterium]